MRKFFTLLAFLLCTFTALYSANTYSPKFEDVSVYKNNTNTGSSNKIGKLKWGDEVTVTTTDNGWSKINYKSGTGWVISKYIKPTDEIRWYEKPTKILMTDFISKIPILNVCINIKIPSHYMLIALAVLSLLAFIFSFDRDEMGKISKCIFVPLFVVESFILLVLIAMYATDNLTIDKSLNVHWAGIVGIVIGAITFCIFQLRHLATLIEIISDDFGSESNCLFGILAWPIALICFYITIAINAEYLSYLCWIFVISQVAQVVIIALDSKSIAYGILGALLYIITSIPSLILLLAFALVVILITLAILLMSILFGPVLIGTYVDFWGNTVRVFIR